MTNHLSFQATALRAIEDGCAAAFVAEQMRDDGAAFQAWLNSETIDLRLFLPLALALWDSAQDAAIAPAKQWIVEQYRYVKRLAEKEPSPGKPMDSPVALLRRYEEEHTVRPRLAVEATRLIVQTTDPTAFADYQHELLFEAALIRAGGLPHLDEVVVEQIRRGPEFFANLLLVSNLAVFFGPRIIPIYLKALAALEEKQEYVASALLFFTGITGEGTGVPFDQAMAEWYAVNQEYLSLNSDVLFPTAYLDEAAFEVDAFAKFLGKPQLTLYKPNRRISPEEDRLREVFASLDREEQKRLEEESHHLRHSDFQAWLAWMNEQRQALLKTISSPPTGQP
jgi:hypothetical protein